ncbi:helix-turn-helix domain-containing protein [Paenibacillus marinisediminis]
MKLFKKWNTVYYKLILSYIALILITLIFVGVTSYLYFTSNFNEQVQKVNHRMLAQIRQIMEDKVVNHADKLYLQLVASQEYKDNFVLLFNNTVSGKHMKIQDIYEMLQMIVTSNSDILDSISVYYKVNNMVISSRTGMTIMDNNRTLHTDWIETIERSQRKDIWLAARPVSGAQCCNSQASDLVTFVRAYPIVSDPNKIKGYVAIHVNEQALHRIIRSSEPIDVGQMLLIDTQGDIVSDSQPQSLYRNIKQEPYIRHILQSSERSGNFIEQVDDVKSMITYQTLGGTDWKLINITPVDEFYKKSTVIRNTLILICIIAILIGIIISNIFTFNMYHPLRSIIAKAAGLFHQPQGDKTVNEYHLIDKVINNLSNRVHELQDTLTTNMPIIKHNFVTGLLCQTIRSQEELAERVKLLQMDLSMPCFCAVLIKPDPEQMAYINLENSQFLKYHLIEHIEACSDHHLVWLVAEYGNDQLCAIVGAREAHDKPIVDLLRDVSRYVDITFSTRIAAAIGPWVISPLDLHLSFHKTHALMNYQFFLPANGIYYGETLLAREGSNEVICEEYLEEFAASLRTGKIHRVRESVQQFVDLLAERNYSAEHCHHKWREAFTVVRQYLIEIHYKSQDGIEQELREGFKQARDIIRIQQWLISVAESAFQYIESRSNNKNNEIVQAAMLFIQANLGTQLSLDMVAEQVQLSPRYLSRIFKEETGLNFTDFVTKQRLQQASELILTTNLNVEQISTKVGFNSSAYFIKKFKHVYGVTPTYYKHTAMHKIEM